MGKPRRKHSLEFKLEAVRHVVEQGRTVSEVADGLGINRNMLSSWKKKFEAEGLLGSPGKAEKLSEIEEENRRLRRELAITRQEREILKKAAAYFANDKS
jgi:transposase